MSKPDSPTTDTHARPSGQYTDVLLSRRDFTSYQNLPSYRDGLLALAKLQPSIRVLDPWGRILIGRRTNGRPYVRPPGAPPEKHTKRRRLK